MESGFICLRRFSLVLLTYAMSHRAGHRAKMEETLLGWESLLIKDVLSYLDEVDQMVILVG